MPGHWCFLSIVSVHVDVMLCASPIVVSLSSLLNPSSPEFTVHGLAGGTYCFVGTAYDIEGLESFYSNEACTSPPNSPPNLAPILLLLLDDNS